MADRKAVAFESDPQAIVRHMEACLGPIARGVRFDHDLGFQVVVFERLPRSGATTLATLGLSKHALKRGPTVVRQELILPCLDRDVTHKPEVFLALIGEDLRTSHRPLDYGQVIGPSGPIFEDSPQLVEFVALLPLAAAECRFARRAAEFEALATEQGVDFLDWHRKPMILPPSAGDSDSNAKKMSCATHGEREATFVCQHLVRGTGLGFFMAASTGSDGARPHAWCGRCDRVLMEEGEWNDRSEGFAKVTMICAGCYDASRERNGAR